MNPRRGGFTLLEVLVGLTVAALVLLAGMAALGTVNENAGRAEVATIDAVAGASQRALLVDWLSGARYRAPTGEQFEGMQQDLDGEMQDLLFFPTTARTPIDGPYTVVGMYIDIDPETPERGLVAEMTGSRIGEKPRRFEIAPEAASMRIRYLTSSTDGFAEWVSVWQSREGLPRAIEITLEAAAGDSLPRLLRLPIRAATAGAG
jgi:prepilin-type N-terminal cleavage/methylation domain-containing protein